MIGRSLTGIVWRTKDPPTRQGMWLKLCIQWEQVTATDASNKENG